MRSAETVGSPLIQSYVREISPDLYGAFWVRRRIVSELTDHLLETTHRFHEQGLTWAEAEQRAIGHFGSPRLVARTFATSKGVGVPTTFTRYSGLAGIVGTAILLVAMTWQEFSESFMHGAFAEVSLVGLALLATGLIAMYLRSRGQLGRSGRTGFQLLVAGVVIGWISGLFWFGPGAYVGLITLLVGVFTYVVALYRADIYPRGALLTIGVSVALTLTVGVATALARVDIGRWTIATMIAIGAGLMQICWFMFNERPVESSDWDGPAQAA